MKTRLISKMATILFLATFFLSPMEVWARLPKPVEATGVVLAVDVDTQTLVFKVAKTKKPFVLDWDKDTQFVRDGQTVNPSALKIGSGVVIHYKSLSFRNPLLKKVSLPPAVNHP